MLAPIENEGRCPGVALSSMVSSWQMALSRATQLHDGTIVQIPFRSLVFARQKHTDIDEDRWYSPMDENPQV